MYDFLIVGSGLFGSTLAYLLKNKGYKVLVLEKRDHIGGNIYTKDIDNIKVHLYGAHIFHTSNKEVWDFINKFSKFSKFNNFINSPLAKYKDKYYHMPFNMNTFYEMWGEKDPEKVKEIINKQVKELNIKEITNLEEQALSLVGKDIYETLIKGYTQKQWGKNCSELPSFIIKRIPLRFEFNNNYFNDIYQGIPEDGYTKIIERMLNGIEVKLNVDFNKDKSHYKTLAKYIVYTGAIDEYYDYSLGELEYRSLKFEIEKINKSSYQGNAVINYTEYEVPYTRIIEHKFFDISNEEVLNLPYTIISKEYPKLYKKGDERYYPINDDKNNNLYLKYLELSKKEENVFFGGRLASYKYYDMDDTIEAAFNLYNNIIEKIK